MASDITYSFLFCFSPKSTSFLPNYLLLPPPPVSPALKSAFRSSVFMGCTSVVFFSITPLSTCGIYCRLYWLNSPQCSQPSRFSLPLPTPFFLLSSFGQVLLTQAGLELPEYPRLDWYHIPVSASWLLQLYKYYRYTTPSSAEFNFPLQDWCIQYFMYSNLQV